ncbi:hypothetical protein WME79_45185 [Sorangium sp. So ce726]|uniref:hypothetical protein n=1 Tax=Sorangium sp. So ce726 TaxID=3133319 RepID=UPI003F5D6DB8
MNETPPPPLALSPAALPDAPLADALRLVALDGAPVLLASSTHSAAPPHRTDIWALPLAGRGPSGAVATIPQLLPALPRWDAAAADGGALSFVVEVAGGAMNALVRLDGASGVRTSLTAHRPFASFSGPRFVRGAGAGSLPAPSPGAVSAVVDNATGVVLEAAPAGGASVERPLGECIDVVVLAGSPGPTAVCKRVAPGASRGGALPGTVRVSARDAAYGPAGAEDAPFGDRRVFELDADRAAGGLVIVATSAAHLLVAHRPAPGAAFRVLPVDAGGADPATFSAPCVLVTDRTVTIAVLSKARTPDARALVATWPLDPPP